MSTHKWAALVALILIVTIFPANSLAEKPDRSGGLTIQAKTVTVNKPRLIAGKLLVPESWPEAVQKMIAAANRISNKPYIYGGGHGRFNDRGYDCSGAVSYVLRAAKLLRRPLASGPLMSWGRPGVGAWFTVYSNPGHAFIVIAGRRFDTSGAGAEGPRWRSDRLKRRGFAARTSNFPINP